jgi:hypothetical protein
LFRLRDKRFGAQPVDINAACAGSMFDIQLAGKRTQADELHARSMEMKPALISTAAGAILLVSASLTSAQEQRQNVQPSARQTMVENANASAQSTTDVSYGGVPDTQSSTGGMRPDPSASEAMRPGICATSPRCNLYSKH